MESRLYLINLYEGNVESSFDSAEELKAYLKRKRDNGTLMGRGAYTVAMGRMLSIDSYYPE